MNDSRLVRIRELLRATQNEPRYHTRDNTMVFTLQQMGIAEEKDTSWILTRETRIALAQKAIELGAQFEEVIDLLTWKDFEGFVAHILSENGFRCIESFRRKGTRSIKGMEIDVIGIRGGTIVSADAKMWGIRKGKSSALKAAAENQKERSLKLVGMMSKLSEKMGHLSLRNYRIHPILVTWLVEEVGFHEGVPIVPIFKFNSFILNLDSFQDLMVSFPYRMT